MESKLDSKKRTAAKAVILGMSADNVKNVRDLLCENSITVDELSEWLEDSEFLEYVYQIAGCYAVLEAPSVWRSLLKEVFSGDTKAIKLYFQICGRKDRDTDAVTAATMAESILCEPDILSLRKELFEDAE